MRCLSTANDAPGIVILNTDRNGSIHKNHLKEITLCGPSPKLLKCVLVLK